MTSASVDAIGLGLPEEWEELPLDAREFESAVPRLLERLAEAGVPVAGRRRVELLQRQIRDLLREEDVIHAAMLAIALDEQQEGDGAAVSDVEASPRAESAGEAPALLTAAALISVTDRHRLGAPSKLTADLLLRVLPREEGEEASIDLDAPSIVQLPAGRAVRLARLQKAAVRQLQDIEFLAQSYLVPIDGGERLCTLQLVTPSLEHGGAFSELFDAIARTLRIFREGEPTTFADLSDKESYEPTDGEPDPDASSNAGASDPETAG